MKSLKKKYIRELVQLHKGGNIIDYNDIFSLVDKHASIRIMLTLVTSQCIHLEHMYVKTIFIYGNLNEQIYMEQA